jgi:probable HAF family extracellular repeat protein
VLLVCWESALAQTYEATQLGLLPGGIYANAGAINNAGQVVGGADSLACAAAVIWNGTTPTVISCLPPLGMFNTYGIALNNFGIALVYQSLSGASVVGPGIDNMLGYDRSFFARNINDSGRIVGTESIPSDTGPPTVAITWATPYATTWTVLPQLPGNESGGSFADGINNAGRIVGASVFFDDLPFISGTAHATLWSAGKATDLGTLGGTNSGAAAISDSGQIVGQAETASGAQHAASWTGTKITDLGTLGGTNSYADAINTSGEIVGAAETSSGVQHAALFVGGKVVDLNSTLSPSLAAYITLREASGINDSHVIVANGVDSRNGRDVAFLLTPSTEVLNCLPGNVAVFKVAKPSNFVSSNVSPNVSGNPSICALPSSEPPTWYIKTTTDGGATWHWKYMLGALGLGELPSNLEVLNCLPGNFPVFKVVKPSNSVSSNVSPNSAGNPSICAVPSSEPVTWYIKTTTDGGATWHWKYMLQTLGLGK